MAKKKVVDVTVLEEKLARMMGRQYISVPYTYNGYTSGNPSLDAAVQYQIKQATDEVVRNVNNGMMQMFFELRSVLLESATEVDIGLCGLCRPDENACMPVDFRPVKTP